MKKYIAVLGLKVRCTIYKIFAVLFVMAAAQTGLFYRLLKSQGELNMSFEDMVAGSYIPIIFAAAFLVILAVLSFTISEQGGVKTRYTMGRLGVSEGAAGCMWAVYGAGCFILLWGVQLGLLLAFGEVYINAADPATVKPQTLLMAFYSNGFMHSILPLAETSHYVRNVFFALAFGAASVLHGFLARRDGRSFSILFFTAYAIIFFSHEIGTFGSDFFGICVSLCVLALFVYHMVGGGQKNE